MITKRGLRRATSQPATGPSAAPPSHMKDIGRAVVAREAWNSARSAGRNRTKTLGKPETRSMVVKASQRRGFARLSGGRVTDALYVTLRMRSRSLTSLQEDGMPDSGHVMLTVLLHHDQSKTLDEIMAHLKKTGFYRDFPPEGSELVSWVVAMSFGFVINLKVEADKARSVNRYMEQKAWGAFRYQVFPSYDFAPIAADLKKQHG